MPTFIKLTDPRLGGIVGYVNMDLVQGLFRAPDEEITELYEVGNDKPVFQATETPEEILAMMTAQGSVATADLGGIVAEVLRERLGGYQYMIPALTAEIVRRVVGRTS